jgi:hypothetical protein
MTDIVRRASAEGIATWDEIVKRSEGRVGNTPTVCFDCKLLFQWHGVPCARHTLPEERAARARAIGVTR